MNKNAMTIWDIIAALARKMPADKAGVEEVLKVELVERESLFNNLYTFYVSAPVVLQEGVVISRANVSIKKNNPVKSGVGLEVSGACITLSRVRAAYGELRVTGTPRGGSLEEATYYTAEVLKGEVSFGFKEKNPDCLAHVAFKPLAT